MDTHVKELASLRRNFISFLLKLHKNNWYPKYCPDKYNYYREEK